MNYELKYEIIHFYIFCIRLSKEPKNVVEAFLCLSGQRSQSAFKYWIWINSLKGSRAILSIVMCIYELNFFMKDKQGFKFS